MANENDMEKVMLAADSVMDLFEKIGLEPSVGVVACATVIGTILGSLPKGKDDEEGIRSMMAVMRATRDGIRKMQKEGKKLLP